MSMPRRCCPGSPSSHDVERAQRPADAEPQFAAILAPPYRHAFPFVPTPEDVIVRRKNSRKLPSSTPFLLRRAQLDDLKPVVDILRSSASWYEPFVDPDDLDQHEVDMAWARENFQKRDFYVGELDGRVVGVVTLQDAGDFSYLGYVYLHADHTGRGLGRRLLDFAQRCSRRQSKKGMVLIAHPKATWATRAYERYGFDRIAKQEERVLAWNDGWLQPYYEKGFHLYRMLHEDA